MIKINEYPKSLILRIGKFLASKMLEIYENGTIAEITSFNMLHRKGAKYVN